MYKNELIMSDEQINVQNIQARKEELILELKMHSIKNDKVIDAIKKVPREEFVPQNLKNHVYEDTPLSIGYNQTISSPYIVAYMIQAANLKKDSKVLEIGTGSGYQTAILSLLCDKVFSIEIIAELAKSAEELLKKLGFYTNGNIKIQVGSGYNTAYKNNFFEIIIVTAAPTFIPKHLKDLLKINGRLIIPVGNKLHQQKLLRITKKSDHQFIEEELLDVRFVPMVE